MARGPVGNAGLDSDVTPGRWAATLLLTLSLAIGTAGGASASEPGAEISDAGATFSAKEHGVDPGTQKGAEGGTAPAIDPSRPRSAHITGTNVKGPAVKDRVEVKYLPCDNSTSQCDGTRAGCITESGNPNNFDLPVTTHVRVNDGPWQSTGRVTCGPPDAVTIPGGPGQPPVTIPAPAAPPVPTLAQIQTAFRELPFSKPSVTIQPKGLRTLKNFTNFYAASWPDDTGLQPGETSRTIKLLSWNIEFKVAARDYRYHFGDGQTSVWTSSTGGTYPDGDITHQYAGTGDKQVKVDARLTGQYRVNGGQWQDIATVADLQDEPLDTLQVFGTKTQLVADDTH